MKRIGEFQIELHWEKHPNGRYYVSSGNVPGLHLGGRDIKAIRADIEPVVKQLLKNNLKIEADHVRWMPSLDDVIAKLDAPADPSADVSKEVYVVSVGAA